MKNLLYVTVDDEIASVINTKNRVAALRRAGYSVTVCVPGKHRFMEIVHLIMNFPYTMVYIRIDGSCRLYVFSILKLFRFHTSILWEIHGFHEENISHHISWTEHLAGLKQTVKRTLLSYLADGYIFISKDLMSYAETRLAHRAHIVIPNFKFFPHQRNKLKTARLGIKSIVPKGSFIVLWVGNGKYHWHALDTIEKIAKKIYIRDTSVVFVLISDYLWHTFSWQKNIIFLKTVPQEKLFKYIQESGVCLALYHKQKKYPFYNSPLKMIDYMASKKPVIASNLGQIKEMIVNGENGFRTNSIDEIVRKILYLKKNPDTAKAVGISGYRFVAEKRNQKRAIGLYKNFLKQYG